MGEEKEEFHRIQRLPPYVFAQVDALKIAARRKGEDIIDLGMGNPDLPTPQHIVDKVIEATRNPRNHRYPASRGSYKLRVAIPDWYRPTYDVDPRPDPEATATIGSKDGIAHPALATLGPGYVVFVPDPTYPIHSYCVVIAGGDLRSIPLTEDEDFFERLQAATKLTWPKPKMLIINFPHNPTTRVVDRSFFEKVIQFAQENQILVVHDLAYADLVFDGYKAPSILQIPGAKELAGESYTLSKRSSMPGWRVGFAVGNRRMINALTRVKSYFDYGIFQPIQIAAIIALNSDQECVREIREIYQSRRDILVEGLNRAGWEAERPKATMFVWAEIPPSLKKMGSLEFSKLLLREAKVAVSPGIGFAEWGEGYV